MECNAEIIKVIDLPTYTSEESMIRTKLKLGLELKDSDIAALANDIVNKFGDDIDFKSTEVRSYLDKKYPGWYLSDKLINKVKRSKSTIVD